jgi:hypothetical protein
MRNNDTSLPQNFHVAVLDAMVVFHQLRCVWPSTETSVKPTSLNKATSFAVSVAPVESAL